MKSTVPRTLALLVAYCLVLYAPYATGQAGSPFYTCEPVTLPNATRVVEVASDDQLQAAVSNAQPGDRIVLADGNYAGFYVLNVNGTAAAPIVFVAQNPRQAIVSGTIRSDRGRGGRNLGVGSSSFVHFYNLRFTGGSVYGVAIGKAYKLDEFGTNHDIRLQGCEIDNANQSLLHVASDSYNIEILCNDIHDNAKALNDFCEGIYLGVGSTLQDAPHDVTIRGNHIYNIGRNGTSSGYGEAIDIKAPSYRIFIEDNLIESITAHSQGAIVAVVDDFNYPTSPNTGIRITRNRIRDVRKAPDGFDGVGIWVGKNGVEVSNNLIWDVQKAGILVAADAANTTGTTRVWNNTVGTVDGGESLSFNVSNQGGTAVTPVTVDARNNLTLDGASESLAAEASDFVGATTGTANAGTGSGSAFALASGSGAIDGASDAPSLTQDITGSPRPQGSGYDYGAFEYADGGSPVEANTLRLVTAPETLTAGESTTVEVEYTTTETSGNIPVQARLLSASGEIIVESTEYVSKPSGTLTFTIDVPASSTGTGYQWNTQMFNRDWSELLTKQTITGVSISGSGPDPANFGVCNTGDEANGVDCYVKGLDNNTLERDLGEGYWSNWYVSGNWKGPLKAKFGPYGTPSWVEWNNQNTVNGAEFDIKIQKYSWHEYKDDVDHGFPTQIKEIANPLAASFQGNWTQGSRGRGHINMTAWIYQNEDNEGGLGTRSDIIIHAWDNSGNLRRKYDEEQEFTTDDGRLIKFRNLGPLTTDNGTTYQVLRTSPGGFNELASYNLIPNTPSVSDSSANFETSVITAEIDVREVINKLIDIEENYDGEQIPINNSWYLHGMEWTVTGQTEDNGVGNSRGRFTFTDYTIPDIERLNSAQARTAEMPAVNGEQTLSVFPNPFTNVVEYEYQVDQAQPVTVELFGLDGRKLRTLKQAEAHRAGTYRGRLDTRDLGSGTYVLRISSSDGSRVEKLIKR